MPLALTRLFARTNTKIVCQLDRRRDEHLSDQHKLQTVLDRSSQPTKNSDLILYFSFYHSRFVFILFLMCLPEQGSGLNLIRLWLDNQPAFDQVVKFWAKVDRLSVNKHKKRGPTQNQTSFES